jgi:hypothetical protein
MRQLVSWIQVNEKLLSFLKRSPFGMGPSKHILKLKRTTAFMDKKNIANVLSKMLRAKKGLHSKSMLGWQSLA